MRARSISFIVYFMFVGGKPILFDKHNAIANKIEVSDTLRILDARRNAFSGREQRSSIQNL